LRKKLWKKWRKRSGNCWSSTKKNCCAASNTAFETLHYNWNPLIKKLNFSDVAWTLWQTSPQINIIITIIITSPVRQLPRCCCWSSVFIYFLLVRLREEWRRLFSFQNRSAAALGARILIFLKNWAKMKQKSDYLGESIYALVAFSGGSTVQCAQFLPRHAMHSAVYAVARCMSVCPVRHTPVFDTPNHTKRYGNTPTGTPPPLTGCRMHEVWKNRDFRPIYRFISETIQDKTIVSLLWNARIGNRTKAFELYHFQWSWTISRS